MISLQWQSSSQTVDIVASLKWTFWSLQPCNSLFRCQCCCTCYFLAERKFEHITPLLRELHWLCIPHQIDFKLVCSLSAAWTVRLCHTSPTSFHMWRTSISDNGCALRQPWPSPFRRHVTPRLTTRRSVPPHPVSGTTCHMPSPRRPASLSFDTSLTHLFSHSYCNWRQTDF